MQTFKTALCGICLVSPLLCVSSVALAQVETGQLVAALRGKTVASTVTLGYQATTRNPVMVNGRPAMFPAKTEIFPDGHVFYRVESGILHADADRYTSFKPEALFQITKVEAKGDCLEIEMAVSINSTIPDPKLKATVKLMLGNGWQQSMNTAAVVKFASTYLPDTESLARAAAAEEARRSEEAEQARIAAEQAQAAQRAEAERAKAVAEQARAEAQAKADALAAQRREESEKKIPAALLAKAKAGDAESEYQVGHLFSSGERGIEKDDAAAFFWFQKSAEQGNAKGENGVGASYEYGNGVAKDYAKAVEWLRKSAEQGNPKAEDNLGDAYYYGWGVPKDFLQALMWYHKSAAQGYVDAEFSLGWMYANGEGVQLDFLEAATWYRKAAALDNAAAETNLGVLYANGQGVPQDNVAARNWYIKAAKQGNEQAKKNLANLPKAAW